jgi:hypothetical protein
MARPYIYFRRHPLNERRTLSRCLVVGTGHRRGATMSNSWSSTWSAWYGWITVLTAAYRLLSRYSDHST